MAVLTDYQRYRLYEMLPGLSVWLTLVVAVILSFTKPLWMIYFIIIFDIYWVLKVVNFVFYLLVAWHRFHKVKLIDWKDLMKREAPDWQEKRHIVFLTLYKSNFYFRSKSFLFFLMRM